MWNAIFAWIVTWNYALKPLSDKKQFRTLSRLIATTVSLFLKFRSVSSRTRGLEQYRNTETQISNYSLKRLYVLVVVSCPIHDSNIYPFIRVQPEETFLSLLTISGKYYWTEIENITILFCDKKQGKTNLKDIVYLDKK